MRYLPYLVCLWVLATKNSSAQTQIVEMRLTYKEPYCGGARPTPEILEELAKPRPYAGKTLIFVNQKNKVDSVKTDNEGTFSYQVKPGKYRVYEAWRFYRKTPDGTNHSNYDKECLKKEWSKALYEIVVDGKNIKKTELCSISVQCPWNQPCMKESAMPPRPQ